MKDAYYFSHDANARRDPKIMSMTCDYGMEGYGLYWVIIEILREQDGYVLKKDKNLYKLLSRETGIDPEKIENFIGKCCDEDEYDLLVDDGESIYSISLLTRMQKADAIRVKRKIAADKRWAKGGKNKSNPPAVPPKPKTPKKPKVEELKPTKTLYMDFVYLENEQYDKLVVKIGEDKTKEMITRVNGYIGQIGEKAANKKYKSHYHVIMNWIRKDEAEKPDIPPDGGGNSELSAMIAGLNIDVV